MCNTPLKLNQQTADDFQKLIHSYNNVDESLLKLYPMSVSYIVSSKPKDHNKHFVGLASWKNPYVIFMNDYIVQLYDSESEICFNPLYGLNNPNTYLDFINCKEDSFKMQFVQKDKWQIIANNYYNEIIPLLKEKYSTACSMLLHYNPSESEIKEFLYYYESSRKVLMLTEKILSNMICRFWAYKNGINYE